MTADLQEIGAVARELGVAPSTLRTWERRYRLIVPHRGDHGQRLYDSDQILTLRRVLAQLRRGARARAAHDLAVIPKATRVARVRFEPSPGAPALARRAIDDLLGDRRRDALRLLPAPRGERARQERRALRLGP